MSNLDPNFPYRDRDRMAAEESGSSWTLFAGVIALIAIIGFVIAARNPDTASNTAPTTTSSVINQPGMDPALKKVPPPQPAAPATTTGSAPRDQ